MSNRQDSKPEKPTFIDANRRGFLQGAAVTGGAAAGGVSVAAAASELEIDQPADVTNGKGYKLTDHIRKYYQRARF